MRRTVVYSSSPRLFYQESHLNNLLGALVREGESHDRRLQTAEQLREWLKQVDPSKVNPKMVPKLTNAICRAFVWRQKELRTELVECLRLLGKNFGDFTPLFFHHFRLIIDPETQNSEQLQRFNTQYPGVPELTDEEKSHILKPTIETVQHYVSAKPEMLPTVVTELAILLSHANSADIYVPIITMFTSMVPQYVDLLGPYFNDTIDVCVGWYISVTQRREAVRRETERFLLLMHPLWCGNPNAVVDFLLQFSEDLDKYFAEYKSDHKAETQDKIFSLFEIFKIICDCFTGGRLQANTALSSIHANAIVSRLLVDVSLLSPLADEQKFLRASFSAFGSFVPLLPAAHLCDMGNLHKFILTHLAVTDTNFHLSTTISFLKLVSRVVRTIGSLQLPDFLLPLLSSSSPIFSSIPFMENCEIVEADVEIIHAAFSSKQVALVTQIYAQIVERMKTAFNDLANTDVHNGDHAERQILFGLAALRRIATDKLDLFGVHLFTPTIFDLLSRDIRPFGGPSGLASAQKLATNSGLVQTAIFSLLVGHMQGHSYFVANSELVENGNGQKQETAKRTSKYLAKFLRELAQVLSADADYIEPAVRLMALNATTEVIAHIINYRPSVLRHEIISRLLNAVVRSTAIDDREALLCAINCLSSLFPYAKFISRRLFIDLFEIGLLHIGSSDEQVSVRTLALVEQLAISLQTSHLLEDNSRSPVAEIAENDENSLTSPFCGILMSFSNQFRSSTFQSRTVSPAMFSTTISYLLQASNTRPKLSLLLDVHSSSATGAAPTRFYFLAWLTALCDVANHCVFSKLKTQLGKPQDTLLALELQLKRLAEEANSSALTKRYSLQSAVVSLDQNRRIIDFLDHLERGMYNAFEGTAVVTAPPPKQIRSFFATNRATCEEWLSRVRHSAMTTAWTSGAFEAAIRHGMEMLADWRRMGPAVNHEMKMRLVPVAVCLTRCFCKLRCPALISGLHAWCVENCGRKLSWLKPAVTFCAERYEQCINQATQRLDDFISDQSSLIGDRLAVVEFLLKLSVDCFEALHDWEAFEIWREGVKGRLSGSDVEQVGTEIFSSSYLNDVSSLHSFTFSNLDKNFENSVSGWGFDDLVRSVRQQNIRLIALLTEQQNSSAENVDQQSPQIRETIAQLVKVTTSASGLPSVACLRDLSTALMENRLTNLAYADKSLNISLMASLCDDFFASNIVPDRSAFGGAKINDQLSLKSVIDVITLTKFRQHLSESYECGEHCLVNAAAVRLARKQGLGGFASKLLLSQLQNHVYLIGGDIPPETADGCVEQLAQMSMDLVRSKCRSVFTLRCEYVKLFRDANKPLEAADAALSFALSGLNLQQNNPSHQIVSNCCAKQLLLVAKWLQSDPDFAASMTAALNKQQPTKQSLSERLILLKQIMDRSLPLSKLSLGHVMNPTEHLIGQILAMAANQSPTSSKAWMQLGGWCHFWGRKAIVDAQSNGLQLSEEEYRTVVGCLPPSVSADQTAFSGIVKIITKLEAPATVSASDSDNNADSDYRRDSSVIEQQLVAVCPVLAQSPDSRAVLLAVWRAARQRLFTLYNMAAVAYFSFVNLNPQITEQTALASLRLLRLLAKHAWELQAILENSLQSSPVGPWRAIVPQLFARLGHPEPYVTRAIADLLCRIAMTAPHEIVYPAVAGFYAYGGSVLTLSRAANSPAHLVSRSQQQQSEDLKACYSQLVEALAVQNASLVSQVCDFVSELTRIAVLWDELVLNILAAHQSAISRRFSQLNEELAATFAAVDRHHLTKAEANAIAHWKYGVYMKPVLALFESVRKLTSSREPETDHERWFSSTLLPIIDSTIEALTRPRQLGKSARHSQLVVKQLLTALQQGSAGLQAAGAALNLEFMSPNLIGDKFKNVSIPLPGSAVTLYAVEPQIYILPTKTKPKKISFIGSDGKTYSYLLKGIEDLHLDERMMQLLRLVNTTFIEQPGFRARNYAVTPLGRRSGLIRWVDGITPAFTVYKRWQQRSAQNVGSGTQVPRPADLYFSVTSAILKKAGLPVENRRDKIPASIQRRAMEQLVQETPGDLMARELWSSCANSPDWFRKLSSFNKSVATMSIVGYIIGLGDRHLDNILIDLARAEVVHIDYNVCFEKGLRLRIPEKVPFRMSQNIEHALGVFGCEGLYRSACEYVMNQLRKSREVLLTLLEAFLYDPLIDWTLSDNNAEDTADVGTLDHLLPRNVVLELHKGAQQLEEVCIEGDSGVSSPSAPKFSFKPEYVANLTGILVKVAEHREEYKTSASTALMETLTEFSSVLRTADSVVSEHRKLESRVASLRQCWQLTNDSSARQLISSLPQRLQTLTSIDAERSSLKQTLGCAIDEETEKQTVASNAVTFLTLLNLHTLANNKKEVSFSRMAASVSDFLNTIGQTQLLSQLEALEREFDSEISSRFGKTFAPLTQETLQFFLNRASPYFSKNCNFASLGYFREIERLVPTSREDLRLVEIESLSSEIEAEKTILERWTHYSSFLYPKWVSLRRAVSEAMMSRTTPMKGDLVALNIALQSALADLRSDPSASMIGLANSSAISGSLAAAAAFSYVAFDWLQPQEKPIFQWMPIEGEDQCGLFAPTTVVEFLLSIVHSIGDDLLPSLSPESALLMEIATSTLTKLHALNLALIEASYSFVSTLVPKFFGCILSNENPELNKALRSGRADDIQWYIERLMTSSDSHNNELSLCVQQVSTKLTQCLSELAVEGSLSPAIFPRLFISHAILYADNLASRTVGRLSAFQVQETSNVFDEIRSCIEKLFFDQETGLMRAITKTTWQLLAIFLGIANFTFDYNQPVLPPDIRSAIPHLFMLDDQSTFPYAVSLFEGFQVTFVATKSVKFSEISAAFNRANLATLQAALTAFEWFNGEFLPESGGESGEMLILPTYRTVSSRIEESNTCLQSVKQTVVSCQHRFTELTLKVMQRLKWAAGSNQELSEIITKFSEEKDKVDQVIGENFQFFEKLDELFTGCRILLEDRSRSKQLAALSLAGSVVDSVKNLARLLEKAPQLTEEERLLVDSGFITEATTSIDDVTAQIGRAITQEDQHFVEAGDQKRKAIEAVNNRAGAVRRHLKAMVDFAQSLLPYVQALKRIEDALGAAMTNNEMASAVLYFSKMHAAILEFCENAANFQRFESNLAAINEPLTFVNTRTAAARFVEFLVALTSQANEALSRSSSSSNAEDPCQPLDQFVEKWFAEHIERFSSSISSNLVIVQKSSANTARTTPQQTQNQQQQQQQAWNQQALSVWQRVRAKLDGRDGPNKDTTRLSVVDHVSLLITQSRDIENLAAMYEGWTPWV